MDGLLVIDHGAAAMSARLVDGGAVHRLTDPAGGGNRWSPASSGQGRGCGGLTGHTRLTKGRSQVP